MKKEEYLRQYQIGESHWWFRARRQIIIDIVNKIVPKKDARAILDLGCGPGNMLRSLAKFGKVWGLDDSQDALLLCKERGCDLVAQGTAENTAYSDGSFDMIFALDILEHCHDDMAALNEAFRMCKNGGYLILTVPAYSFLWSGHDIAAFHKRRYIAGKLMPKIKKAGFSISKVSYFNTLLFLPQCYFRMCMNIFDIFRPKKRGSSTDFIYTAPSFMNEAICFIFGLERYLVRNLNLPFGLSLLCIARKEG